MAGIRPRVSSEGKEGTGVVLDVNGAFEHVAGATALRADDVAALAERVASVTADLSARRERGELPFYGLPYDEVAVSACESLANDLRDRFTTLVVLGIGGSALGTRAAIEAVPADLRDAGARRVEILDNIDPSAPSLF
jgi:glucose-6-phosphate isomerase